MKKESFSSSSWFFFIINKSTRALPGVVLLLLCALLGGHVIMQRMNVVFDDAAVPAEDWGAIEEDPEHSEEGSKALSFDSISIALGAEPEPEGDGDSLLVNRREGYLDDDESEADANDKDDKDKNSDSEDEEHEFEFAVGPQPRDGSTCAGAHDMCCPTLPRVGNMLICHESKRRDGSRQLNCVFGPCWPFMFMLTLPLIVGISALVSSVTWKYTTPTLRAVLDASAPRAWQF